VLCALAGCADDTTAPAPPESVAVDVTVAYCTGLEPSWVAFQDGDGAWTRVLPTVNGPNTIFHRAFHTNRGGIATLVPMLDGALTQLSILFGLPGELASVGDVNPRDCPTSAPEDLSGRVAGLETNESALVSTGLFGRSLVRAPNERFSLPGLSSGPHDLLATRIATTAGVAAITGMILRRNVDLPDGDTIPTLDFASAEAFAPAPATVSIVGLGAGGAISGTRLRTSNSETAPSIVPGQTAAPTRPYFSLPEGRLLPGDLQVLLVLADEPGGAIRSLELYFRAPADRVVALGAPVATPVLSAVATAPALGVRARFVPQDDYDRSTSILFQQDATSALVGVTMTAGYAAIGGAGYDLIVPDLTAAQGFDLAWALRPGQRLSWSATRAGGTLGLGRDAVPADGMVRRAAFLKDTVTLR